MVKQETFKTCSQSGFCVRHRAFAALRSTTFKDPIWRISDDIQKSTHSLTADLKCDQFPEAKFRGEWYLFQDSIRFKMVEVDGLSPRYEFPFSIESLPEGVKSLTMKSAGNTVNVDFGDNQVVITKSPFSFKVYSGKSRVPAMDFNSRDFLYYEPYRKNQTVPPFAVLPGDGGKTEEEKSGEEKKLEDLKRKVVEGLSTESFGGKTDSKPKGSASMGFDIAFPGSKHVFGIPEHASSFSLKATRGEGAPYSEPYRLYNLDVFEYILDSPMALYGAVPFMMSHKKDLSVGLLFLNSAEMWIDIEKNVNSGVSTHWMAESGIMDLFMFLGPTQTDVFNQFTRLTGRPQLPQKFATAYHQCRWNYNTEKDALEVDENFDKFQIPYDVLWLDIEHTDGKRYFTWDNLKFPNPETMQKTLSDKGRRMVTIVDPHIKRDDSYYVSKKAKELDLFVKNQDGTSIYDGFCWPGDSNWLDYSNPKAREYWADQFLYKNYKGSTPSLYTWNDMNEPAVFTGPEATMPKDVLHYENVEHRDIHNGYGMLQHRSTFEGHLKRSSNKDRPFILSRSFFVGTQRYGAIWTGDNTAEWGHLLASVPMLLSVSIAGITFSGGDVGGFFGNPDPELLLRWYQVGSLQPFLRAHAHIETKRREPWLFGEPYTTLIREAVERRYRLLPYIYTLFQESSVNGSPIMRSMMQEFPQDETTFGMDDQFMLGPAILIKPVTEAKQASVKVYLPPSVNWYDYDDFALVAGREHVVDTPLSKVPVFLRGGQIVVRKDRIRRSSQLTVGDPFTLIVALDGKKFATGRIYVDDGSTFEYKNGNYLQQILTYDNGLLSSKSVDLPGNPANNGLSRPYNTRVERIVIVGLDREPDTIKMNGKELIFVTRKGSGSGFIVTIKKPDMLIGGDFELRLD